MDVPDIQPHIDTLSKDIDNLESALEPLLNAPLQTTASKLPLLDKAKLYTLSTYAIESILFNFLRINGTDAKTHPIYTELQRVKQYMDKIKAAELGPEKRTMELDKGAAGRFVKAGLAGNDKYDRERAERQSREKEGAKRKLDELKQGVQGSGENEETEELSKEDSEAFSKQADAMVEGQDGGSKGKKKRRANHSGDVWTQSNQSTPETYAKKYNKSKSRPGSHIPGEGMPTRSKGKGKGKQPPKSTSQAFHDLMGEEGKAGGNKTG